MATITATANRITLARKAEFCHWGENVFVPLGHYAVKDLAEALDRLGDDVVVVDYRTTTDPRVQASDAARFSKRLADLGPGWSVGPWANKVVRGFVFDTVMVCELRRVKG